LKKPHYNSN